MILLNHVFSAPQFATEIAIYCRKNFVSNIVGFSASLVLPLLIHSFAYNFSLVLFRSELTSIKNPEKQLVQI